MPSPSDALPSAPDDRRPLSGGSPAPGVRQPAPGVRQPGPGARQPAPGARPSAPGARLSLREVTYAYPGAATPVLDGVSLDVAPGQTLGLVAPSGSGKTTLLRVAALLLAPRSGSVRVGDVVVGGTRFAVPVGLRRRIGIVVQSPRASTDPRLTLRHIVAAPLSFAAGRRTPRPADHVERIAELADLVQLSADLLDRLPHQVSDGQLQRACLARALALDPDVLLCDEPTAMLDAPTTAVVMRVVTDRVAAGAAALVASHDRALLDATCTEVRRLGAGD